MISHPDRLNIIIPCWNPTRDLIAVVSAIDYPCQFYRIPMTIFISDDCSKNTEIYDDLRLKSAKVSVHRNDENLGEYANVNEAVLRLTKRGRDWFILCHADDVITPEWLQRCAEYIARYDPLMPPLFHCLCEG